MGCVLVGWGVGGCVLVGVEGLCVGGKNEAASEGKKSRPHASKNETSENRTRAYRLEGDNTNHYTNVPRHYGTQQDTVWCTPRARGRSRVDAPAARAQFHRGLGMDELKRKRGHGVSECVCVWGGGECV